jgi:hypothetical protein
MEQSLYPVKESFLARISHQNDEKFARRVFAEMICDIFAKRLIFCALKKQRAKLWT